MRRETQSRKKHKSAYKKIGVLFCAFLLLIMNMYPTWACDFVVSNYSSADIESVENSGTETDEEASPGVSESEDEAVDTETPPDVSESEDEGELPDSSDVEENTGADEDVSEPDEGGYSDTDDALASGQDDEKGKRKVMKASAEAGVSAAESGYVVTGGVEGTDYEVTNAGQGGKNVLLIKTGKSLTIKNANPAAANAIGIQIAPNIEAHVTLAGVNIHSYAPFNLMTPTVCYLTLADGTTNTLDATGYATAGLHCGGGSTLYIDDSVPNWDTYGDMVTPKNGMIGEDVTLANGDQLKAGDSLRRLNSTNIGKLVARGGAASAGIGTGPMENGGTMVFNGGHIDARGTTGSGLTDAGAGIGMGSGIKRPSSGGDKGANGGTMIFNSAKVYAKGAYHAAGIGAGYSAGAESHPKQWGSDPTDIRKNGTGTCGNIFINGGYLQSVGGAHGNAFGGACGTTATGNTIKVTGGTLLPYSVSGWNDIGGAGGTVIVSGGSVNGGKFQSSDGKAYADDAKTTEVKMVTIDLGGEKVGDQPLGERDDDIEEWDLSIGGANYPYGAPSKTDKGKLYLWLPASASGKEIKVDFAIFDGTDKVPFEPFYVPEVGDGNTELKRYVDFTLPEDYAKNLVKKYDGKPFGTLDLTSYNDGKGIYTGKKDNKYLLDNTKMEYSYLQYDKEIGAAIPDTGGDQSLSDAGYYLLTVTSGEFTKPGSDFAKSYWGHRATGFAEIQKVNSKTTISATRAVVGTESSNTIEIVADIVSADDTAVTCGYPTGEAQFYIDGKPLGKPVKLDPDSKDNPAEMTVSQEKKEDERNHTVITYHYVPSADDSWILDPIAGNKHKIEIKYTPDKNYYESKASASPDIIIVPIDNANFKVEDATDKAAKVQIQDKDTLTKNFDDLLAHKDGYYYFPLDITTDSKAPFEFSFVKGDKNLAEIIEEKQLDGSKLYYVKVKGSGTVDIQVKQPATSAYKESKLTFTLKVPLYHGSPVPETTKKAVNLYYPDKPVKAGDTIKYTISTTNKKIGTVWTNVIVWDKLPEMLELQKGTIKLHKPDGTIQMIPDNYFDETTRILKVPAADQVMGGEVYQVTFLAKVADSYTDAQKNELKNIATASGYEYSGDPDDPDEVKPGDFDPEDYDKPTGTPDGTTGITPGDDIEGKPGNPAYPDDDDKDYPGQGTPSAPSLPEEIVPESPTEADLTLVKNAENTTRKSGKARPGDVIKYTITIRNTMLGSVWYNAAIVDPLPAGLELDSTQPITVMRDGKTVKELHNDTGKRNDGYDDKEKTVGVYVGDLYGAESATVEFYAIVGTGEVKNIAKASGLTPDEKEKTDTPKDPGTPKETADQDHPNDGELKPESKPVSPEKPTIPIFLEDPDNPDNPDDPDSPDNPDKPTGPQGGINIDTDGDGIPDINIDIDGDGVPDINIDTDGHGKADINIDTDGDGIADTNIDTNGNWIADANIVQTSDRNNLLGYVLLLVGTAGALIAVLKRRKC